MTGSELRRTVGTEVGREQIGVLEVVAQTSEVGKDGPVGCRRTCACPADLVGAVQRLDVGIGIVGTIDPVVAVFRTRPRGTCHEVKAVDAELTLVVEHIVPNHYGIDGTRVVARTVVVSTIARLDRVEEVHRSAMGAVEVELAGEGQALGEQRDDGLACAQELVPRSLVVLGARKVFGRRSDVDTIEIVIVLAWVLGIPDGGIGGRVDDGGDYATAIRTCTRNDARSLERIVAIGDAGADGEPLADVVVDGGTHVVAAEVTLLEHTILSRIATRKVVAKLFVAIGHRKLVVLGETCAIDLILPVGTIHEVGRQFHQANLVLQGLVLLGIERCLIVAHGVHTHMSVEANLGDTFLALLGADDDDAIGCTRTVDGCRRGILEHLDALDVICTQIVDIGKRHSIDHVERVVRTVERSGTAYTDGGRRTRLSVGLRDLQACSLALHTRNCAHDGAGFEVLGRYGRNGCGHILAPYRSITDYHYLVQVGALLFEHHLHVCLGFHLLSGVADVRYSQRGSFGDSEGELSVNISYSTIACTNFKDRGPYDRLIVRIGHHTIHCKILS